MNEMNNKEIGIWGEGIAATYLIQKGYSIVLRNYYTSEGEIDIIAFQEVDEERMLVFVEVKTRTSIKYGFPEEAITKKKWDHLLNAVNRYFQEHPEYIGAWQIDVIAVQRLTKDQSPNIDHFENVVMDYGRE